MMPASLRELEIGRVLLESDLVLKKLTASRLHPESPCGRLYWAALHDELRLRDRAARVGFELSFRLWMRPDRLVTENHSATILVEQARLAIEGEGTSGSRLSLAGADGPFSPRKAKDDSGRLSGSRASAPAARAELRAAVRSASAIVLLVRAGACLSRAIRWGKEQLPHGPLAAAKRPGRQATVHGRGRGEPAHPRRVPAALDQGVFYLVRREPMMGPHEMAVRSYFSGAADFRTNLRR